MAVAIAFQGEAATLVGTVRDAASGRPIPGAIVALLDLDRSVVADESGRYQIRQVGSGPQHITVRSIGFAPRTLHALVPPDGRLEINIALQRDPIRLPALEVRAAPVIPGVEPQPETDFPDRQVSRVAMTNHPLLAEPDALLALGGGVVSLRPEAPSGVHIRGAAADQTGYILDGIPVLSPYHAAGLVGGWNPDALERVRMTSSAVTPELPDALGGVIAGETRPPGSRLGGEGSIGTSQARLTVDGPLGRGVGFLIGLRSGFPDLMAPRRESSYLRGATGDWVVTARGPLLGGRWRVIGIGLDDEIGFGATAGNADLGTGALSNHFEWHGQSIGAEWRRSWSGTTLRWLGWSASSGAAADWAARAGHLHLTADRTDRGVLAVIERRGLHAHTSAAVRVNSSQTAYRVDAGPAAAGAARNARTLVATAIVTRRQDLGERLTFEAGASAARGAGRTRFGPHARLQWRLAGPVTATLTFDRLHQYSQSIRNPESVVSTIFPVDLFVGSSTPGVPVARSDVGVIGVDSRLGAGVRVGAQAYRRRSVGLALAAPRGGEPFSTGSFANGTATASGLAVDASVSTARFGLIASYGWQRARLRADGASYFPDQGATHTLDVGVIVFPSPSSSLRLGLTAAGGRHATAATGGFEWESCNLIDRGCEFTGSPYVADGTLGRTALPGYLRLDLGFRKHWHIRAAHHDASVALFGTFSNLLGRKNLLTYAMDPITGGRAGIEMRPPAPLVVGLDWRF